MRPCVSVFGHALDAVAAALVPEVLVDARRRATLKTTSLNPPASPGLKAIVLDLPALGAGVAGVHLVQVAGEQGRLVAAGAGPDFDDQAVEVLPGSTRSMSSTWVFN